MKLSTVGVILGLVWVSGGGAAAQDAGGKEPLRVFIRAGKKTHGPGQHDHPRFLEEWKPLLASRGAAADGALEFPTAAQLEKTDVLVFYCAEGGTMNPDERGRLEAFTKRGGGIVVIHDAVCGNDAPWFKTVVGGAWEHGKSKWHEGKVGLYVQDYAHPITAGLSNFFVDDEIYWDLHLMPEAKVIGTSFRTAHDVFPQMWVYEKDAYRAFVSIPGHRHTTFSLPHYRAVLLRGIAWAGKRDVDLLTTKEELATLRYPEGGPTAPSKSAAAIQAHPDFALSLLLAEPEVVKPISFNWDPKGRLWVLETPQYPNKATTWKTRPYDRLTTYEDADGDGRPERRKVFYEQFDLPTSFVFHRDGVVVMQSPEILFIRDSDGDGVGDRREVVFQGFGFGDTHATASNLRWGLDGWIYGTQGYSGGGSNVRSGDGATSFGRIGNGLFRFKPDGSAIEMVSAYGSNTWGMDFSWDGEIFFTMANGSHLRHVILSESSLSRGRVGKVESWKDITDHRDAHPPIAHSLHPYLQIDNVGGFTAAAGSTLYDGGAWPDEWRKIHFVTECTINLVHQDRVEPAGVTFQAKKVGDVEFMGGQDLWFRPIDTQIGPDGALYIADFYNQAVIHNDTRGPKHGPFNAAVRPDRDHLHGRIWRLQHKQAKTLPAADLASTAGLLKALEHPNRFHRLHAQRLLCERGEGAEELAALLKSAPKPETRVLALWILQRQGKLAEAALAAAMQDGDPGVRKNAARAARETAKGDEVRKALLAALQDADPRVRLEALAALGALPPGPVDALLAIAPRLDDAWSKSALLGALAASPVESFAAAVKAGDASTAGELAASVGARQDAALAARLVVEVAALPESAGALRSAALARLGGSLKPEVAPALTPDLAKSLEALLGSADAQVVSAALTLAARWVKDGSLDKVLEPVAKTLLAGLEDRKLSDAARVQNLVAVLSLGSARAKGIEAGAKLLDPSASADLQRGAIEALGAAADPAVPPALMGAWPRLSSGSRDVVLSQLLKRQDWSLYLVDELAAGRLKPNDLGPAALFRLRTHPEKAVADRAQKALGEVLGAQGKAKEAVVAQLWPHVDKAGDNAKGKALFTENCLKCHQYKGEGRSIAPDLTGMGAHGKHELLVHLIDPNKTVEGNYVSFNVRTKSGEVFNGIVARETNDSVVLKNNEGDKEIRRADIDAMRSTGLSLMPEGLEALGADAIRDILSYLAAEAGNFRVIDLQTAYTASSVKGLYDPQREPHNLKLRKFGIANVEGIPFNLIDPAKSLTGLNAIVLKGGAQPEWHCKTSLPKSVEVPMGFSCAKIHVLGGIAAWGTLNPAQNPRPVVRVTFHYADGKADSLVLRDGAEFADWIRRVDVRGSKFVDGLIQPGAPGQLRWFTMTPPRSGLIHHLTLESYDNTMAPTFLAMTAEVASSGAHGAVPQSSPVVMVGGGSSHDFDKWWRDGDAKLLGAAYTSNPAEVLPLLGKAEVLVISNNQALPDPALRKAIFDHVDAGKGLLISHAGAWYNWRDWSEWNRDMVAGGSRGHEKLQEFEVTVVDETHPLTAGVPKTFRVKDELYRYERDAAGPEIKVLAIGTSLETGKSWPVLWTVARPKGRVAVLTLGHDGAAHDLEAYRKLLTNARVWLAGEKQ
jgi:putative membrane-bound dehydrogenase-like protein